MRDVLLVALGGSFGSVTRYAAGLAAAYWLGKGFPWGTLLVNVAAASLLTSPLGHFGIALAVSISSWANALGLAVLLWRRQVLAPDAGLIRRGLGTLAAVAALGAVLLASRAGLGAGLGAGSASALALLIGAGALTFAVAAWLAGAVDPGLVRGLRPASRA